MPSSTNVVIICGYGYHVEQLKSLLISLSRNSPASAVRLFLHRNDRATVQALQAYHPGVEVLLPPDYRVRSFVWRIRGKTILLRSFGGALSRNLPFRYRSIMDEFHTSVFHVSLARYFWALQLLDRLPDAERVMLTDARDVVVQEDPFQYLEDSEIWTGLEDRHIGECDLNSRWISTLYGDDCLAGLRHQRILCSGVTLGSKSRIEAYLETMCGEMVKNTAKAAFSGALDQGIHNFVLRSGRLPPVRFSENRTKMLATLHYANLDLFQTEPDGEIVGRDGTKICILHQYDRHGALKEKVERRYANT